MNLIANTTPQGTPEPVSPTVVIVPEGGWNGLHTDAEINGTNPDEVAQGE